MNILFTLAALLTLCRVGGASGVGGEGGEACPAGCDCGEAVRELEYSCSAGDAGFTVTALPNNYARFTCQYGELNATAMPFIPLSQNGTLSSVTLRDCTLPSTFASLFAQLGARAVPRLTLDSPHGELTAGHAVGLGDLEMLIMLGAAHQTRIPYDVLALMPKLKDFVLRGANLHLDVNDQNMEKFPPHPALRTLELSVDNITSLPPRALAQLGNITQLFLWQNEIANITEESFAGLDYLEDLDLSSNPFEELPARALASMPRLRSVTLVSNHLKRVDTDSFSGLKELENIQFRYCEENMTFAPRALGMLPSLKILEIELCPLDPLPGDLFEGSIALEEISIKGSELVTLPAGLFRSQTALKALDLTGNRLATLDPYVLWPLQQLQNLTLDDNALEELPGQLFSGLTQLKSVSMNSNRLQRIAADAFQGATGLELLSLAENKLTLKSETESAIDLYLDVPHPSPFKSLQQLKELRLQGNRISEIFSDWMWWLIQLKKLDLSRNNLTEITRADVQFLGTEMVIDLRQNHITTVELMESPPGWNESSTSSNVMLLDNNPFRCDCELYTFVRRLQGSKPMTTEPRLDPGNARCAAPAALAGRLVRSLTSAELTCALRPQDCPANCTCDLRPATLALELDCLDEPSAYPNPEDFGLIQTHLRLHRIKTLVLPTHVTVLNLTGVRLTIPPHLELFRNVQELDLSENDLTTAPTELLASNMTLHLTGNPFVCDCWHSEDISDMQKYVRKIADANNVTCSGGESLWHVDAARLCDVRRAAVLGGTLAAIGVIAAILAAFAYRYTLEIKVFLFSRGWLRSLIQEDEIDKGSMYDAFVSFSQEDAQWVAEKLIPTLEDEHKFKLCVHYRDWVVGDMIPAQIARSVEQSRRTIVVLSQNFLKSTWANLEFRAANVRAQRERRPRLLVVVLGEVPDQKDMDAELRAYLTTNTYLKWGDPWFWEKLRYAMPHKRSSDHNPYVNLDKLKTGGLDARLTADGKIINNANHLSSF